MSAFDPTESDGILFHNGDFRHHCGCMVFFPSGHNFANDRLLEKNNLFSSKSCTLNNPTAKNYS
jgi:hypothetical protein